MEGCVFTLKPESTLVECVEALDKGGKGFLVFVDEANVLKGIITDGDIRRAFLSKKYDLHDVINTSPMTMSASSGKREIISELRRLHRRHMPIVDENNKLKYVFALDDIEFVSKENRVIIMAGGLGTRLGELTKNTPKPMLKVGDKPMLQHLIEMFGEHGFRKFTICVNYKKEMIKDYFGSGSKYGVEIEYVEEKKRLGTAGALGLVKSDIQDDFFVVNADVLTNLNFIDLLESHQNKNAVATMCVRTHSYQVPFGVVNTEGEQKRITSIEEKPYIEFDVNAGLYVFKPDILKLVSGEQYLDMPSLFDELLQKGSHTTVYRIEDYWLDIGRHEDFYRANDDLSHNGN